jgi:hypothetical protein
MPSKVRILDPPRCRNTFCPAMMGRSVRCGVTMGVPVPARCTPSVAAASGTSLARAAGAGCPATSDRGCSELATLSPSLGVVSVIYNLSGRSRAHCRVAELAAATRLGPCQSSSVPARALIRHTGFLNRCARLRFVHTPGPGVTRARRLAPSPSRPEYPCIFQDRRDRLRSRANRVPPKRHQAGPRVSPGVAGTRGLAAQTPVGQDPIGFSDQLPTGRSPVPSPEWECAAAEAAPRVESALSGAE